MPNFDFLDFRNLYFGDFWYIYNEGKGQSPKENNNNNNPPPKKNKNKTTKTQQNKMQNSPTHTIKVLDVESPLLPSDSGLNSKVWTLGFVDLPQFCFGFSEHPKFGFWGFLNF